MKQPMKTKVIYNFLIKLCLERMDRRFTDLSRLKFDEVSGELKEKLQEQKIQERPFAYEFYHQFRKFWEKRICELGTS